ncbi:HEPN domain-containing protein [candidate division KSB1 bacterium]|nr:HEPN domain-containing protein [candidate division KSB1 bacterium]
MNDPKKELVRSWLTKAQHDLGSAQLLASSANPYLDTAIYHCQQAAEKAFKAFLVHHDVDFEKKHNLSILVDLCKQIEPGFQAFQDAATILTPYATAYRYPGEFFGPEPDTQQVQDALQLAKQIFDFVVDHLPEDTRP